MPMTIAEVIALNRVLRWAMGMPQPGTGTISDAEATEAARRLVERAYKSLGAGLRPDEVTLTSPAGFRELSGEHRYMLSDALGEADGALLGDSNDAEHDALCSIRETIAGILGVTSDPPSPYDHYDDEAEN